MGEAKVHREIEFAAWNLPYPDLGHKPDKKFKDLWKSQKNALYVYSGNWMRDYSQFYAPFVFRYGADFPREIDWTLAYGYDQFPRLGKEGVAEIIVGLLRALAILEFDKEITDKVITPKNVSVYKPEEHMDNPGAYGVNDLVIRIEHYITSGMVFKDGSHLRDQYAFPPLYEGEYYIASDERVSVVWRRFMASSAFEFSSQIDKNLLQVGSLGLPLYIYNTNEWIKKTFLQAIKQEDPDIKRMLFGSGFHGIEDYFGHSNFIEVALNLMIDLAEKYDVDKSYKQLRKDRFLRRVDTLFDKGLEVDLGKEVRDVNEYFAKVRRYPIVTGVFETSDMVVSLGHIVLPKMEDLAKMIDNGVDKIFDALLDIVDPNEKSKLEEALDLKWPRREVKDSTWDKIKEKLKEDRQGKAFIALIEGLDKSGLRIPSFMTVDLPKERPGGLLGLLIGALAKDEYEEQIWGRRIPYGFTNEKPSAAFDTYKNVFAALKAIWCIINHVVLILKILRVQIDDLILEAFQLEWEKFTAAIRIMCKIFLKRVLMFFIEVMLGALQGENIINSIVDYFRDLLRKVVRDEPVKEDYEVWAKSMHMFIQENEKKAFTARNVDLVGPVPSHSELCKDHPPEKETIYRFAPMEERNPKYGPVPVGPGVEVDYKVTYEGSLFYQIHFDLASYAVKQLGILLEKKYGQNIVGNLGSLDFDEKILNEDSQWVSKYVMNEKDKIGRSVSNPDDQLCRLVDTFISHPVDSSWWRPIVLMHMNKDIGKVQSEIKRRWRKWE